MQAHRREPKPAALGAPLGETWCDRSSETWYDDAAALQAMLDEPALQELMVDEANFMDLERPRYQLMTQERHLDGARPGTDGVKVLLFVRRPAGTDRAAFLQAWLDDDDVAIGRAVGATRHVVCPAVGDPFVHPNDDVPGSPEAPFDGVRELWWPSTAALEDGAAREPDAWARLVRPDAVDAPRSFALFAAERIIRP